MKLPILFIGMSICVGAAFADDVTVPQKLAERKTCAQIKAEMDDINFIENPDAAMQETLKQLQAQYRSNCMPKSAGRRRVIRNVPAETTSVTTPDALSEYFANKRANCEKLNSEIEKLAVNATDSVSDSLAAMRGVYDMDCVDSATNAPAVPTKTDEELAAEFDANLAMGLCGDGSKPNRYGCCSGETFKSVENGEYACCPKTGDWCFPPIK